MGTDKNEAERLIPYAFIREIRGHIPSRPAAWRVPDYRDRSIQRVEPFGAIFVDSAAGPGLG